MHMRAAADRGRGSMTAKKAGGKKHPGSRALLHLFVVLGAGLLLIHAVFANPLGLLREKTYDLHQSLAPIPLDFEQVVVVAIDEASLDEYGRWPWPRDRIAELVDAILASGAAAVGIDIFLAEPDSSQEGADGDAKLASTLTGARTVLAMSLDAEAGALDVPQKAGWSVVGLDPDAPGTVTGGLAPLDALARAADGLGIVRALPDADGVIRKVPLVWAERPAAGEVRLWPAFSMDILRVAQAAGSYTLRLEGLPGDAIRVGGVTVPLGEDGRIRLIDTAAAVPHLPANELLGAGASAQLGGRIAILAVDAAGLDQYHLTARGVHRLGADVHAMLVSQMLSGRYLHELRNARLVERGLFAGGSLVLLIVLTAFARQPSFALALSTPVIFAPIAIAAWLYAERETLLDGVQPAVGLLMMGVAGGYALYREAERRRRLLQRQFGQFLSPEVVRHLAETDAAAALQVDDREITAMLVDVRGFTALTATLGADQTVALVNHFFEIANREIFARSGTIDKYMGDAVLAFWNAPLPAPDHIDRAIDCARAILTAVEAANPQLEAKGLPAIRTVAVLETGVCSVGNMGTEQRIDYTAIGPSINMTSRLEHEAKRLGRPILIGPAAAAKAKVPVREVAVVQLRGFGKACPVYEIAAESAS